MTYQKMVKAQLIDLHIRKDEKLAALESENAQLRADNARIQRDSGAGNRMARNPAPRTDMGAKARAYCAEFGVRSVPRDVLLAWSQSR